MSKTYRIAVLAGDGIGKEVMPEGLRALEAAAAAHGITIEQQWHDFASCDYYAQHGR
jgi:tartrate dehydrogenase/decarboxylase/D-malate dehydrogenase